MVKNDFRRHRHVCHLQCDCGADVAAHPQFLFRDAPGGDSKGRAQADEAGSPGAGLRALPPVHRADRLCHFQRVSGRCERLLEPVLDGVCRNVFREFGGFLRPGLVVPGKGEGPDHAPGHGTLQGVEHQGVDADPCHPGAWPGVAADRLPPGGLHLRRDRHADSLREWEDSYELVDDFD